MFDIRLSDEQRAYRDLAREFAENEIKPIATDLDKKPNWEDRIPWEVLKKGSKLGFRTFALSEENGGAGASDHLTACLIAEELAASAERIIVVGDAAAIAAPLEAEGFAVHVEPDGAASS